MVAVSLKKKYLGGPPLLDLQSEHFGIRNGLLAVLIFVAVSLYLTRYLEPRKKPAVYTESLPVIRDIRTQD